MPGARDRQLRAEPLKRAQRGLLDDMRMPHRRAQLEEHGPATCRLPQTSSKARRMIEGTSEGKVASGPTHMSVD